jgi:hypothetical protein
LKILNKIIEILGLIFTGIFVLANVTSVIAGIGIFLYYWGAQNLPIGTAAWIGFKWFLIQSAVGFISLAITFGLAYIHDLIVSRKVNK